MDFALLAVLCGSVEDDVLFWGSICEKDVQCVNQENFHLLFSRMCEPPHAKQMYNVCAKIYLHKLKKIITITLKYVWSLEQCLINVIWNRFILNFRKTNLFKIEIFFS